MSDKKKKTSWIVKVECTVIKEVVTTDCTEEEAKMNPFAHSAQETEIYMPDYTVKSWKENT